MDVGTHLVEALEQFAPVACCAGRGDIPRGKSAEIRSRVSSHQSRFQDVLPSKVGTHLSLKKFH